MLERFFNRKKEEKESFESVDPVVEERRKQKFSRPLIYDDNEMEVEEEIKVETKKTPEPVKKSTVTETTYQMSEIISPMTGIQKSKKTEVKTVQKPKIKKIKKQNDELIPIISPFYGPAEEKKQESKPKPEVKKQEVKEPISEEKAVADNIRNLSHIVEEEQNQLKIIEERTGEFKLDFQKKDEDSLIDEIDDSISLDELMSLYEKKFKD